MSNLSFLPKCSYVYKSLTLHKTSKLCANKDYEHGWGPLLPIGKYWPLQNLILKWTQHFIKVSQLHSNIQ